MTDKHVFHLVNPCLDSFRLLYSFEKPRLLERLNNDKLPLYSIKITDWKCVLLKAEIEDIICIKNHLTTVYRIVKN